MKKLVKIILVMIVAGSVGGFIWWQQNKKRIVKDAIQDTIKNKTDSLYTLHYDSSFIDELNGNAVFFNVSLQSDSAQKELLASKDSLPASLFFIKVKKIEAVGVDIVGLMKKNNVTAKKILLDGPQLQIVHTGSGNEKPYTAADTLALYQRILGKFKTIHADTIQVNNGLVIISDRNGKPQTTLENINISLKNFLVDSTHNYNNLVSYFIKDVAVSVDNIQLPETPQKTRMNITKLLYDATARTLQAKELQQYRAGNTKPVIDLKNISVTKLNTDAFIMNRQLKAGLVQCDGGLITVYRKSKIKQADKDIEFSTDFDAAQVDGMKLGSTKVVIINEADPSANDIVLNDVRFEMNRGLKVFDGNTLTDIITYADWKLSSSGFVMATKDKMYNIVISNLLVDNVKSNISAGKVSIVPLLTEAEFAKKLAHQKDRYDMAFNNIKLNAVNFKRLIADGALEADNGSVQTIIKVFNDRTVTPDTASKVGKAPFNLLLKMKMPVNIKRLQVINGLVAYKERGALSEMTGTVDFTNVNAVITNITNMPAAVRQNGLMKLVINAKFLGEAPLNTTWQLPLTAGNGNFTVGGNLGLIRGTTLNRIIEPLGMASVTSGKLNRTQFILNGDDYKATGDIICTYNDLKIELLKKGEGDELKKKSVASFLANAIILNNNPAEGKAPRKSEIENDRQLNRSFFNLLWKSIFKGVKKIAVGKKS